MPAHDGTSAGTASISSSGCSSPCVARRRRLPGSAPVTAAAAATALSRGNTWAISRPDGPFEHQLVEGQLHVDGVVAREAAQAEAIGPGADGGDQVLDAQVLEAVGPDAPAHLLHVGAVGDELARIGDVDAQEAGPADGRRRDAHVDLAAPRRSRAACPPAAAASCPARCVSSRSTMRLPPTTSGSGLYLSRAPSRRRRLRGLDERAPDVAVAHEAVGVGQPGRLGEPGRGGDGRVGHADDEVGVGRALESQPPAHLAPHAVDEAALQARVGPLEVDVLEGAHGRALGAAAGGRSARRHRR